jgi:hypothetical protein
MKIGVKLCIAISAVSQSPNFSPPVELGFDPIVVWSENLACACSLPVFAQTDVSRYRCELAGFRDRRLRARRAIAVDDETRIVLLNHRGIERVRYDVADRTTANVPGDVAFAFGFRNPEPTEDARNGIARVISDNQERRSAVFILHGDRCRLGRPLTVCPARAQPLSLAACE